MGRESKYRTLTPSWGPVRGEASCVVFCALLCTEVVGGTVYIHGGCVLCSAGLHLIIRRILRAEQFTDLVDRRPLILLVLLAEYKLVVWLVSWLVRQWPAHPHLRPVV